MRGKARIAKYKAIMVELLNRRAAGPLSIEEESRFATEMTDIWWLLSDEAQAYLETWIRAMKQQWPMSRLQETIKSWALRVLGRESFANNAERALRVAEEAVELAQCMGVEAADMHRLVDYVYARPAGTPAQEIAGTLVTLYAAAASVGVDAEEALRAEVERIHQPEIEDKVRRRQAEKRALVGGNYR